MENQQIVRTSDWIITFLLMIVPIVNIVMLFVWSFGSGTPPSKANWAKASLLLMAITIAFYIVMAVIFGVSIINAFS